MSRYDREGVIKAIDELHEGADWHGWPEAERLALALGWENDFSDGPYGEWIRARLNDVLR